MGWLCSCLVGTILVLLSLQESNSWSLLSASIGLQWSCGIGPSLYFCIMVPVCIFILSSGYWDVCIVLRWDMSFFFYLSVLCVCKGGVLQSIYFMKVWSQSSLLSYLTAFLHPTNISLFSETLDSGYEKFLFYPSRILSFIPFICLISLSLLSCHLFHHCVLCLVHRRTLNCVFSEVTHLVN